jgi:hypothetical protein
MNDPNGTVFHQGYYHVFTSGIPTRTAGGTSCPQPGSGGLGTPSRCPKTCSGIGRRTLFFRGKEPPLILYTAIGPQMDYDRVRKIMNRDNLNKMQPSKIVNGQDYIESLHDAVSP